MIKPYSSIQTFAEQKVSKLRHEATQISLISQSNKHWHKRTARALHHLANKLEPTPHPPTPHAS